MNPKVRIVILPYDNIVFFERAIRSILENTEYSDFEVVAVHNPCSNPLINEKIKYVMEEIKDSFPYKMNFIINEENLYHGKGSMVGVNSFNNHQDFKFICLMNDDIFIPGNQISWLDRMVEFMEENKEVATLTPSLYHLKETVYWCGRKEKTGTHDFLHFPKGDPRIPTESFETAYNNMAICLTRKFLLDEFPLGEFCPHYGSDESYCNQIKEKYPEMKHIVIPQIKLYHENIYYLREGFNKDPKTKG